MSDRRVVVIGAGLAGLVTANALKRADVAVTVLEATPHVGGKLRTLREDGYLIEWGPQSFLHDEQSAFARAIEWAGLSGQVVAPGDEAKKRFVLRRGRLRRVPGQVPRLLSILGLIRAATEVFRGRGPEIESVDAFARRRFGNEVADVLINALVSGIFAGDPARLELQSALPKLAQLERDHGSVVRAVFGGGFKPRGLRGFEAGMGSLTEALGSALNDASAQGDGVKLETVALSLSRKGDGWVVESQHAQAPEIDVHTIDAQLETHGADAVVIAAPAPTAASLLGPVDRSLADTIRAIPYAPLAAIALGYDAAAFPKGPPEGFGFLVPRVEGVRTLGCLFPSTVFPSAAPEGKVLLRVMIGGRLDPEAIDLDDDALVAIVRGEVEPVVGAQREPELVKVIRHSQAIPQYELGHLSRVRRIEAGAARQPGLFLTGNPYRGVSLSDVAADGERTAAAVVSFLQGKSS